MTRLYLAGADTYYKYLEGLSDIAFLVSYYYLSKKSKWSVVDYAIENNIPLMLDSGAYTAMTKGIEIDNKKYIEFCKQHCRKFQIIVSLDVIGDAQKSKENHDEMLQSGINGMPTFHYSSPFDAFFELIEENQYIGIGGIAGKGRRKVTQNWLKYLFDQINTCKFHGFGVTTPNLLAKYDWHSIDGTTWMTAAIRYGRIMINLGDGRFKWIAISKEAKKYWYLLKNDFSLAWDLEKGKLEKYEEIAIRYNAKSLIELVQFCSKNKINERQPFLL